MDERRMSHACILCAPTAEESLKMARRLAQKALCERGGEEPCGRCAACRKVLAGVHPDLITVRRREDDSGRPRREITVDQIREVSDDACVLPNEAARKVYLISEADKMNPQAQNAALKLLEEPPNGAVFLLCVTNPALLLPTVRSRCASVNAAGTEADTPDDEAMELAVGYIKAVNTRDEAQILRWCAANEGLDAKAMAAFLEAVRQRLLELLSGRQKGGRLSRAEMLRLCALADRCTHYLKVNTNVKQLFGLLAVDALPDDEEPRKSN